MLRSCDGKLWQLLDSENDKLTLRYAKFVIKRRGGTGRFVSKPPVSLEWPPTSKRPDTENCIAIHRKQVLADGSKFKINEGIVSKSNANSKHITSVKDNDSVGRMET